MTLLADGAGGWGAALLPVVAALLFEELTLGGLVRLLIAPWPGARKDGTSGERSLRGCGRDEHNHPANQRTVCAEPRELQPGNLGGGK
jgi:hypothetical protein